MRSFFYLGTIIAISCFRSEVGTTIIKLSQRMARTIGEQQAELLLEVPITAGDLLLLLSTLYPQLHEWRLGTGPTVINVRINGREATLGDLVRDQDEVELEDGAGTVAPRH